MQKRAPQPSPEDLARSVRARLASGRSMAALKEAKELAKRAPGEEADLLLAEAYRARVADLAGQGLHAEANELLQVAAARYPALTDTWRHAQVLAARAAGNLDDLLLQWRDARDDATRARVGAELQAALRDPQVIAASAILPDEPLRLAAARVHAAFVAAADAQLSAGARDALRALAVPAALVAWRDFALALDAFHRHDDDAALAALAQIPDTSGVARGKRLLLDVLHAAPLRDDTTATRRVALRLTGGAAELYAPLAALASPDGDARARRAAARPLLLGLAARAPRTAARLVWHLRGQPEHDALVQELDQKLGDELFGQAEWMRLTADLDAEEDPVLGATTWWTWLMPAAAGDDLRPLSDVELAEILQHLTTICLDAAIAIDEQLGVACAEVLHDPAALDVVLAGVEDELQAQAEDTMTEKDRAAVCASVLAEGMRRVRARTRHVPRLRDVRQLAEHACALDPRADRFMFTAMLLRAGEDDVRQALLEQWTLALPGDAEPWLDRVEHAIAQGDHAQARTCLTRAAALAQGRAVTRASALDFCLRLFEMRQSARDGEVSVCGLLLDELAAHPAARDPVRRAVVAGARGALGLLEPPAVALALGDADRADVAVAMTRGALLGTPVELSSEGSVRQRVARAAWVARLAEVLWASDELVQIPDVPLAPGDMPEDDEDRLRLCLLGQDRQLWDLVHLASGRGLLNDGPLLPHFLLYRARAVDQTEEDVVEDVEDLFALARWHALRTGDVEVASAADALRRPLTLDLDAVTAATILERERKLERGPRPTIAAHARPVRRRSLPRERPPDATEQGAEGQP